MMIDLVIFAGTLAVICLFAVYKIAIDHKRQKRLERARNDAIEAMRAKDVYEPHY